MRGQYLTVEYVLFFTFGVAIVVVVYLAFLGIGERLREEAAVAQLERTGEAIRGIAIRLFEAANATNSNIAYNISIPQRLSGCSYIATATDSWLSLNCTDNYKIGTVLSLYGIPARGTVSSSRGVLELIAKPDSIEIR